jgi:hypothetical protein
MSSKNRQAAQAVVAASSYACSSADRSIAEQPAQFRHRLEIQRPELIPITPKRCQLGHRREVQGRELIYRALGARKKLHSGVADSGIRRTGE